MSNCVAISSCRHLFAIADVDIRVVGSHFRWNDAAICKANAILWSFLNHRNLFFRSSNKQNLRWNSPVTETREFFHRKNYRFFFVLLGCPLCVFVGVKFLPRWVLRRQLSSFHSQMFASSLFCEMTANTAFCAIAHYLENEECAELYLRALIRKN